MEITSLTYQYGQSLPGQVGKAAARASMSEQFRGVSIKGSTAKDTPEVRTGREVKAEEAKAVLEEISRLEPYTAKGVVGSSVANIAGRPAESVESKLPTESIQLPDMAAAGLAAAPPAPVVPQPVVDDPVFNSGGRRDVGSLIKGVLKDPE